VGLKIEYHRQPAIGGRRHCGDAEYSDVPHLKNFVNKPGAGATENFVAIS
jgi:hypothetical protein